MAKSPVAGEEPSMSRGEGKGQAQKNDVMANLDSESGRQAAPNIGASCSALTNTEFISTSDAKLEEQDMTLPEWISVMEIRCE
jgi:hypothetical protein